MANAYIIHKLPRRIAKHYFPLRNTISKIQKTSASIGFVKKALYNNVTPTFAKISGCFANEVSKKKSEKILLRSHLSDHYATLRNLTSTLSKLLDELIRVAGTKLTRLFQHIVRDSLRGDNIIQFKTKNGKLHRLTQRNDEVKFVKSTVPVKNLSSFPFNTDCLKMGLQHSFTDKNKYVKRNIAVELEHLAICVDKSISSEDKETFMNFYVVIQIHSAKIYIKITIIHLNR